MSRDFLDDLESDGLRHYLVREARADRPSQGSRDRALRRIGAAAGVVGAGVAASAAAKGAVATSQTALAWGAWMVPLKWGAAGAISAVVTLGAIESVKSVAERRSTVAPSAISAEREEPKGRGPSSSSVAATPATAERSLAAAEAPSLEPPSIDRTNGAIERGNESAVVEAPTPLEARSGTTHRALPASGAPRVALSPPPIARSGDEHQGLPLALAPPADPPIEVLPSDPLAAQRDRVLLREIALLEEARRALAEKAPLRAHDALSRYERECPSGSMRVEAMALRVEALGESGQYDDARALAREFLTQYPRSPLVVRVRSLVDGWSRHPKNW